MVVPSKSFTAYRTLKRLLAGVRALVILQYMLVTKTSLAYIANKVLLLILLLSCLGTDGWRSCLGTDGRSWRWFDVEFGYTLQRTLLVNCWFWVQRLSLINGCWFSLLSATLFAARHIVVIIIMIIIVVVVVVDGGDADTLGRGIAGSAESR